jgi:hypothetical protein
VGSHQEKHKTRFIPEKTVEKLLKRGMEDLVLDRKVVELLLVAKHVGTAYSG